MRARSNATPPHSFRSRSSNVRACVRDARLAAEKHRRRGASRRQRRRSFWCEVVEMNAEMVRHHILRIVASARRQPATCAARDSSLAGCPFCHARPPCSSNASAASSSRVFVVRGLREGEAWPAIGGVVGRPVGKRPRISRRHDFDEPSLLAGRVGSSATPCGLRPTRARIVLRLAACSDRGPRRGHSPIRQRELRSRARAACSEGALRVAAVVRIIEEEPAIDGCLRLRIRSSRSRNAPAPRPRLPQARQRTNSRHAFQPSHAALRAGQPRTVGYDAVLSKEPLPVRARSSAGEHPLHTRRVAGSSPAVPTISRRCRLGAVAQLVRASPCHGEGRGFEPHQRRHR